MTGLKALWRTAAISTVTLATLGAPLVQAAQVPLQPTAQRTASASLPWAAKAQPGQPFPCTGQVLASTVPPGGDDLQFWSGTLGAGTVTLNPLGGLEDLNYNAIGVNPDDNFVYGIAPLLDPPHLVRIDNQGTVNDLGVITGLPAAGYVAGGFDEDGNYYVASTNTNTLYRVDTTTRVATPVPLSTQLSPAIADISYSNGYFWGADANGTVRRIDPTTGQVTSFTGVLPTGTTYGGVFTYGNGDIGFINNAGVLRRVAIANPASATPTFSTLSTQQLTQPTGGLDATSCFGPPTDLQLTKVATPASYVAGDQITYTLRVRNNGPNPSSGFSVTDAFPSSLTNITSTTAGCTVTGQNLSCTSGALAVNATRDITVTATVAAGTTGTLVNGACVVGNEEDPNPLNDCDDVPVDPATPDLTVTKNGSPTYTPGGPIQFSWTVRNIGRANAATYTVTDTLPAGVTLATPLPAGCTVAGQTLTCNGTDLEAGGTRTFTVNGTVAAGTTGTLNNAVCVETPNDGNDDNNCSDWPVPPSPQNPDLSIKKTGSPTYTPGGQVSYSFVIRNVGQAAAATYTVTDQVPAGVTITNPPAGCTVTGQTLTCTGTNLAPGDTRTITVNGTVAAGTTGTLTNEACVEATGDTNTSNNCDEWPIPPSPQNPDLKIEKSAPATVSAGGQIAYTLTVTNSGPVAAQNYTVTDTLPAGVTITNPPAGCTVSGQSITCTGTNLAVGATRTITLNGTVANNATG
ncbi:hypothetical protein ABZ891_37575, partial [Streptomyces sp. NPDC047023]